CVCEDGVLRWYFFFSSRRRHTRSKRDWSSDVCSSDLAGRGPPGAGARLAPAPGPVRSDHRAALVAGLLHVLGEAAGDREQDAGRSEERRVGEEWSGRGGLFQGQKRL